ncbi:hypothetical protein D3273_06820 [Lichenibacterium minor]|uniref:Uncharacterized protein n=1 Tax=Lichenibacterium minor TaxID=2316528 RepID=A0A4Q2UC06_9HYPH|nr:hypothetical protein [Lichenibacterium minor]RYC32791.1 hypothetical protein D3273_06820 [Lichenibacterium minor]
MRAPALLAVAAALLGAGPARSADIAVAAFSGPTPVITIRGEIAAGDELKFTRFAAVLASAVVELDSTGGRLAPALTIGDTLARKGFSTYVAPHAVCSSACGLIWLAGKPRVMQATAAVGFHAAYVPDGQGIDRENGLSNALIGSYMARLDLGTDAVMFATAAGPGGMAWITPRDGSRYGIPFEVVQEDIASLRTAAAPSPAVAATDAVGSLKSAVAAVRRAETAPRVPARRSVAP